MPADSPLIMRIAFLSPQYAPSVGGVERHVAEIARRAAEHGHEAEVLTQTADAELPRLEQVDGVPVRRFASVNGSSAFGLPPGLFAYLGRSGDAYDLIHAHGYHALPALGALGVRSRPVVFTPHYHGTGHTRLARMLHRPYRPLGRLLFRHADAVVCVSQAEGELVERDFPGTAERLRVIPNGVDRARIDAAEPFELEGRIVLAIGRLAPYKRVDLLVEAVAQLPPDVRLVVIGVGEARAGLESLVAARGLEDRVDLLGVVDDAELARWLRTARVLATMSLQEAYGIVLVEGLAGGARVVASAIPAHAELLTGRDDATLVDVDAPVGTIASALADALGRERPGATSVPSWDDVAARTCELYEDAAASRRRRRPASRR
jgi:glycosyltransferase involved in cell wall biosynthesis